MANRAVATMAVMVASERVTAEQGMMLVMLLLLLLSKRRRRCGVRWLDDGCRRSAGVRCYKDDAEISVSLAGIVEISPHFRNNGIP